MTLATLKIRETHKDIHHWRYLAESNDHLLYCYNAHSSCYRLVFGGAPSPSSNTTFRDDIENKLTSLNAYLDQLCVMLSCVYAASAHLRVISSELHYISQISSFLDHYNNKKETIHNHLKVAIELLYKSIEVSKVTLYDNSSKIKFFRSMTPGKRTAPLLINTSPEKAPFGVSSPRTPTSSRRNTSFNNFTSLNSDDSYIVGLTKSLADVSDKINKASSDHTLYPYYSCDEDKLRRESLVRPPHYERYWFCYMIGIAASSYGIYKLRDNYLSGYLNEQLRKAGVQFTYLLEHVLDPVTELWNYLFGSKLGEDVVSISDVMKSKEAYSRMIKEFAKTKKGSTVITDFTSKWLPQLGFGDNQSDEALKVTIDDSTAWDALMASYEKDLQAPLSGILFGTLSTSMLLQIQKLKLTTEELMLRVYNIIDSNRINFGAAAVAPALLMFFLIGHYTPIGAYISYMLSIYRSLNSNDCLKLRLLLSEVERSLMDVHTTDINFENDDVVGNDNYKNAIARGALCYNIINFHDEVVNIFKKAGSKEEFQSIYKDIQLLFDLDITEDSNANKSRITARMRLSYACLKV